MAISDRIFISVGCIDRRSVGYFFFREKEKNSSLNTQLEEKMEEIHNHSFYYIREKKF